MCEKLNALSCVAQDDIVTLRIICNLARNNPQYNLEKKDYYGNTALLKSCYLGRFECARTLLKFGANVYAINYYGQNALTLATHAGHLQLVLELLRYRTYNDFNLSSLIPAICVATMRQHYELVEHFVHLHPIGSRNVATVHGLSVDDIRYMLRKVNPPQCPQPQLTKKYMR